LENPGSLRFEELCTLARQLGFTHERTRGSHFVFTTEGLRRPLCFQRCDGMAKSFQVRQLLEVARDLGRIEDREDAP
jgi:hypothetical protein